jgi:hypothetical protein
MSDVRKCTLAIRRKKGEAPRKITKIIGLNGDGFSVLAPYHKLRSGFLFKLPVDPTKALSPGPWFVPASDIVSFTAGDRVKLSYHTDGFIQFSGENPGKIISGRDPATGEPKGLGIMTHPLASPIWTGPSATVTAWGLDDFDTAEGSENARNTIVFEPDEIYHRSHMSEGATSWEIAIYPFPIHVVPPVRYAKGVPFVDTTIGCLNGAIASVVRMKVIHLPKEEVFLGVYVNAFRGYFPSPSGWVLGGAGSWGKDRPGHVLKGIYPRDFFSQPHSGSVDRDSDLLVHSSK